MVDGVQDNGVDSLSGEFERCLDFIGEFVRIVEGGRADRAAERGKKDGVATLVHCRVGACRAARPSVLRR